VIFVSVGSSEQPFERLVRLAAALPRRDIVIQHGPAPAPAGVASAIAYLPFEELRAEFTRADAVVTHGGTGSVLLAAQVGHVPIVVPRLHRLGEAVDDHQAELIQALAADGKVIPVWEDDSLEDALAAAPARADRGAAPRTDQRLHSAVRAAIGRGLVRP
jgi:UDP-N-acetylglucosamine transferase subunit ALG13